MLFSSSTRSLATLALSAPLLLALSGCGKSSASVPKGGTAAKAPEDLPVDVVAVASAPLGIGVPAVGTLGAYESVDVRSELSRRLVKIDAREGTFVKKGQPLFELDSADLEAQLEQLRVRESLAERELARQKKLRDEQLTTQQDFDRIETQLAEARAQRRVLEVTLAKTKIRAPFDGTLGLRRVSEGAWVEPKDVLATFQDLSRYKIDFRVPERHGSAIRAGQEFSFSIEGRGETFTGTVSAVEPEVEESTRSVLVRGVVNRTEGLMPGAFANVSLPVTDQKGTLSVPSHAIVPSVRGQSVFVVKDGKAKQVEVKVGVRTAEIVQILSGVSAGDRVVTSNLLRVRDGQAVKATLKS